MTKRPDPYIETVATFLRASPKPLPIDVRLPRISAAEASRLLTDPFADRLITEISNSEEDSNAR